MKRVLIAMTVLLTCWAYAWGEANGPSSIFGIGIREPGRLAQWEFFMRVFVAKRLDLSPGIGYRSYKNSAGDTRELTLGLGGYYHLTYQSPVHLKLGWRLDYEHEKSKSSYSQNKSEFWGFGPAAQAEYFFSSHLSIAPEINYQVGRTFYEYNDSYYGTTKSDFTTQRFSTYIVIVFYF